MSMMSVSDIAKAASLAWEVYNLGWSDELNASKQYRDFGADIRGLAENLNNIVEVIDYAKATWTKESIQLGRLRSPPLQRDWDLTSLKEIIGDYHATLADCEKLLRENHEFKKDRNFAYNVEWNLVLQPKVDHLRQRLDSHNTKILVLLKPLEFKLLSEIHHDLAQRIDAVHRSLLHLKGLLIPDVEQAISEKEARVTSASIFVPTPIGNKFQEAASKSRTEGPPGDFPLQDGANAFVRHFKESTKDFIPGNFLKDRTPTPKQYLNLLKCAWIMNQLEQSNALKHAPANSQWPGYIHQLNENLALECLRFTTPSAQQLVAPDLSSIIATEEYKIWPEQDIAAYISPHHEVYMEEVLKIPLPSPSSTLQRNMSFYRLDSTKYRLVESVEDRNAVSSRREDFKMDIDIKTLKLTPIYAIPSSRPKALELLINSNSTQTNPTFQEVKHIYRLQHLLTGYKVYERYDQAMVTASFFVSGKDSPIEEHGRIQLWLPHPVKSASSMSSPAASTVQSVAGASRSAFSAATESVTMGNVRQAMKMAPSRTSSHTFSSISRESVQSYMTGPMESRHRSTSSFMTRSSSKYRPASFISSTSKDRATSIMTNSSTLSRSSVNTMTTISTGTGRAHFHEKPLNPLLVIFLKSQDSSANLAIAALEIDDKTAIERERCGCRTSSSQCHISCIERSGRNLLLQRWNADQGLGSWNVAQLGLEQRKELPEDGWNNVKRISLKFDSHEDRYTFSGSPCSCKPKMQHDLSECILDRHHGIFGVVKQICCQRLQNYHQDREKMVGRNMVIGSLPEDEE